PERQLDVTGPGRLVVRLRLEAHLKNVRELVTNGVAKLGEVAAKRQRDATLQEIGSAEEAFGWRERQNVGLLEVDVRRVDDEWDPYADIVPELEGQRVVARLGVGQGDRREVRLGLLIVEVDVRALEYPPVEAAVLDLVLVQREELRRGAPERQEGRAGNERQGCPLHVELTGEWYGSDRPE